MPREDSHADMRAYAERCIDALGLDSLKPFLLNRHGTRPKHLTENRAALRALLDLLELAIAQRAAELTGSEGEMA